MNTITKDQAAALKAPFPPESILWRIGRVIYNVTDSGRGVKSPAKGDKGVAVVLAYVNTKLVKDRLDAVLGFDGWAFDWSPVTQQGVDLMTAKGMLTIGGITRADLGEAGNNEKSKGAVRDSLKRAAFLFGVGDYLADLGETKANVVYQYGAWQIDDSERPRLAKILTPGRRPITPELEAVLMAWYPRAGEKIRAMSVDEAIDLIKQGTPPAPKTAQKGKAA